MMAIIMHIFYAFKRDALFVGTTLLVLCCAGLSIFLGSNAVVEAQEAKIVYTASTSRIIIMLGFVVFVSFYIKRMFENKEIEVMLSRSVSRTKVLASMFIGFSATLLCLVFPVFIVLMLLKCKLLHILIWVISLYCEGLIVLSFSLCCSLIIKSFASVFLGCFTFYVVGRIIGNFVVYLKMSLSTNMEVAMESTLKVLSIFIPRLDLFGKSSWLVYGDFSSSSVIAFLLQTLISCSIFLIVATIDLKNKRF